MSLSFDPVAFNLAEGLKHWGAVMLVVAIVAFFTALVTSLLASGLAGPWQLFVHLGGAFQDLAGTSLRRTLALSQLTFREALRRKTLWVFAVFAVLFLFAGWFLSDVTADADLQVKNYVSFVLRTISWLILPVALLLSCWGLPEDIKARSLHTVVTKPVRRHEIVLGRVLGFAAIGGLVLGIMSAVGYVWINRQLPESMRSQLTARVPVYGDIRFVDNEGQDKNAQGNLLTEGINTGDENMFRSFVEGNTKSRAIWEFSNVDPARLEGGGRLVLESSFQAFRTYKGNIEKQLLCQFTLVNSAKKLKVPLKAFEVREFRRNVYDVAEENPSLQDTDGKTVELADLLAGGKLQVETACLSSAQFLGMARPDLFVRLPDRPFAVGYFKSIANIGLMMLMVVVLGVMSGCFLKGPVATMLTLFIVIVGRMAHGFLDTLVTGKVQYHNRHVQFQGAGPIDALYRILTHMTPGVPLEDKPLFRVINWLDNQALTVLWAIRSMFPDFTAYDTTEYTANAFDVPWAEAMLPNLAMAAGYCLPWIIVGYFSLRFARAGVEMNNLTSLQKLLYLGGIVLLLIPITWLGLPAEPAHGAGNQGSPGGYLAQKRAEYGLGESDLGNVDPASSTMNLLLLGFRGIATNILWMDAQEQQRNKDWASLRATTESIILLQPHFLKVWQFQGWNLAYNVSAEWDGVADRYYWVKEGIKFFKKGQGRNKMYGELLWYTGDTTGKKIGRSDEQKQFRRYFRSDPDEARFHGGPDPDVNPNSRDNYLEAGEWFQRANDTIETYGIEQHIMAPYLFRAYPARSQFDYAAALQREGNFGEVTQNAWSEGFQQWTTKYGKMPFECELLGRRIHLEVSGDEMRDMVAREVAQNLPDGKRESFWVNRYQDTTNYRYWRTRSLVETEKMMAEAHRELYEGQQALFRADDATARQRYTDGMIKFEKILNEYPDLKVEDEMIEEAILAQIGWRQCLELVDEEVPEQYPLKEFWDAHPMRHSTVKQEFDRQRRGAR